ncbi:hypothetical protein BW723_06345 [Polaribacter reichenbachii]|uniref:Secretion system C-terminal sorting domain-containing protein n=1 Tax=Polaribacter reichenbachii TaxID=996801 RepID=A0A1B8U668_9FLAO|nr:T9SS type A sorting domain-containing protein [Polaribacter reichenbachii]APZ45934.1 hypothetical protein BW723_06345 [Polaribacter reichenbachii]AUC19796.1 hypothetical protein BTO17_14365 [Polaribacter reichenbachii]OBY67350.1 hypothetical protein LPB301_03145 [Polaribacter reichenbachii]
MRGKFLITVVSYFIFSTTYAQTSSKISIDYTIDKGTSKQVASGLLHGISANNPAQYLIDGIKVRSIRGADYHPNLPSFFEEPTYKRAKETEAKLMIGLYYYRANDSYFPGDGGDFNKWEEICKNVYNDAQTKNLDIYSWITWNEPRLQWGNSNSNRNRYFKAHEVAYKAIKAINPLAKLQAPEDHSYNFDFMKQFLLYCKTNNCLPEILAWHELSNDPLNIEAHCKELKEWMLANEITPMPMTVTEYQGESYSNDNTSIPGVNVYYLASMERAVQYGFEFGLHACWTRVGDDPDFIATLADMADRDNANLPRGLWWNYNTYKDMTGRKVDVNIEGANSDAIASLDSNMKRSVILIGTRNYFTEHDVTLTLNNIPEYLKYEEKVNIRVEKITNEMILTNPEVVVAQDYELNNNTVSLNLPRMIPKSSYAIYISAATSNNNKMSFEAENLTIKNSFTTGKQPYIFNEQIASNGSSVALESNSVGDYIEYTIPSPGAGIYNLSAILKGASNRGFVQLYINGKATCPPEDLYNSDLGYYKNDFGNIEVGTEDLNLKFEVVGKNPASNGYFIVLDKFDLTFLGELETAKVTNINNKLSFNIYPNPALNIINIEIDKNYSEKNTLHLYDNTGRLLINKKVISNNSSLNISKLSKGVYFIKIFNKEQTSTKRIFKN